MATQIVMDRTGDTRHNFDAKNADALLKAEERFRELTGAGFTAAVRSSSGEAVVKHTFDLSESVLGYNAVRRTIGFFQPPIWLCMSCYCFPQRRHPLARRAAEPKKRPERQRIRIKEDPDDAGGGPPKQFDACGHVRTPRPPVARFELHVAGQASEYQRQIIPSVVDLRPQHFQIPHVLAPKPAQ